MSENIYTIQKKNPKCFYKNNEHRFIANRNFIKNHPWEVLLF